MILRTLFLLSAFFLFACRANKTIPLVDALETRLLSTYQMTWLQKDDLPDSLSKSTPLSRPPAAWVSLIEFRRWNRGGESRDCLIYRVPYKQKLGAIKLVELAANDSCSQLLDAEGMMPIAILEQVESFSIAFKSPNLFLQWTVANTSHKVEIPLYNIQGPQTSIKGLTVLTDHPTYAIPKLLGALTDRYGDQTATICHRVDENCISLSENNCSRCRYGWYSLANTHCPQGATKICGINRCGSAGEPACPRGLEHRTYKLDYACIDDSPAAFCQQGLRVVCDGQKNLICQ